MKRSVEVSNDINHPRGAGTEADAQMMSEAPSWWREKVIAIRSAKNEAEVRSICSRAADPLRKVARKASDLAEFAWRQFVDNPTEFRKRHAGGDEPADDSQERRRQALNSLL